jgi:hypothetical protein
MSIFTSGMNPNAPIACDNCDLERLSGRSLYAVAVARCAAAGTYMLCHHWRYHVQDSINLSDY